MVSNSCSVIDMLGRVEYEDNHPRVLTDLVPNAVPVGESTQSGDIAPTQRTSWH